MFHRCLLDELRLKTAYPKDLDIRDESVKLLEENREEKLHDTGSGDDFVDMAPKAQATKETNR